MAMAAVAMAAARAVAERAAVRAAAKEVEVARAARAAAKEVEAARAAAVAAKCTYLSPNQARVQGRHSHKRCNHKRSPFGHTCFRHMYNHKLGSRNNASNLHWPCSSLAAAAVVRAEA